MKKLFLVTMAGLALYGSVSAQSLKVTNTFGGDVNNTGSSDLFVFENRKDKSGSYKNEFSNQTRSSDRLQLDASGKKFDGRARMEIGTTKLNGKESTIRFRGYARFKPLDQLQFIAGNDFSTKVAVDAGYLTASDDTPKYARILQNGFGGQSNWNFGQDNNIFVKLAAGIKGTDNSFLDENERGLDAGLNFGVKKLFTAGVSVQNMAGYNRSVAMFAGLTSVKNLTLNAGYIYNDTDTDFISSSCKNALSLSAGYDFKETGLFAGFDVVSALGNEYLKKGDTLKRKKNDDNLTPFFANVRLSYKLTDSVALGAKTVVYMNIGDNDSAKTELYPNVTCALDDGLGSLTTGVRVNLNKNKVAQFSVPLSWKCVLADIKK